MIMNILRNVAIFLFKRYLLPMIRQKANLVLNDMSDKVMESEYNPVDRNTVGDIRKHADVAINKIFDEFE